MAEFHFLRPGWLLAFIPLALLLRWLARRARAGGAWAGVCDAALLPHILAAGRGRAGRMPLFLLGLGAALGIIALAGPAWERLPRPVFERQAALVIALDLSYSMYAQDIQPSRLERARFKIADLLALRQEGQTALLVYAGGPFTVAPLTSDGNTIKAQLAALSPEIMPAPGSEAGPAIDAAMALMAQGGHGAGHILLVTDGVSPVAEARFKAAGERNYPVSILALGTEAGAPINMADGRLLEDRAGRIVIPRLDPRELRRLARLSGGRYEAGRIMDDDIQRLNAFFNSGPAPASAGGANDQWADQWHEAGAGLVLLILPLAALAFRRGYIGLLAGFMLFRPDAAPALDWRDLWLNKDQQAMRALRDNRPEAAAGLFRDRGWRATAEYRAGRYAEAEALLQAETDERGWYNKGNALARQGRYREASAAYAEVLRENPAHADAAHNKALLEELLARQQSERGQADNNKPPEPGGQTPERPEPEAPVTDNAPEPRPGRASARQGQADQTKEETDEAGAEQVGPQPERETSAKAGQEADGRTPPDTRAEGPQAMDRAQQGDPPASAAPDEAQLAEEQWLRRIPDDPGGLLRRKFRYQYGQQAENPQNAGNGQYW